MFSFVPPLGSSIIESILSDKPAVIFNNIHSITHPCTLHAFFIHVYFYCAFLLLFECFYNFFSLSKKSSTLTLKLVQNEAQLIVLASTQMSLATYGASMKLSVAIFISLLLFFALLLHLDMKFLFYFSSLLVALI